MEHSCTEVLVLAKALASDFSVSTQTCLVSEDFCTRRWVSAAFLCTPESPCPLHSLRSAACRDKPSNEIRLSSTASPVSSNVCCLLVSGLCCLFFLSDEMWDITEVKGNTQGSLAMGRQEWLMLVERRLQRATSLTCPPKRHRNGFQTGAETCG